MSEDTLPPPAGVADSLRVAVEWCRRQPLQAALFGVILGLLLWFFCGFQIFQNGQQSTARWLQASWNSGNDLEHGGLILPAALFIVWYHRAALAAAPKSASLAGLFIAGGGVLLFLVAVRTLQPRLAALSLCPLFYGSVRYLWGRKTARIILFPCVFLTFMVPIGFLVSRTVGLQTMTATVAAHLSSGIGIGVDADGTALRAMDGSFQFEVAGGCSGIRSLTAMTMLAALYVHFTQSALWKKGAIFCSSLLFALLGNFVRIFSVILVARLIDPHLAAGLYHDYSGFVFFPIAVSAMLGFSRLLNRDWSAEVPADIEVGLGPRAAVRPKSTGALYDY